MNLSLSLHLLVLFGVFLKKNAKIPPKYYLIHFSSDIMYLLEASNASKNIFFYQSQVIAELVAHFGWT